ncbi:unnamed protein product [Owenia fusiformis]|uniref:PLAT domain-containing protein n=1 Tax=Owenia fusiformis TaxID=6347 RepID=A0A8S4Q4K2_OWEFU|nr:unnamed protein product [Owenia fusiformis]
MRRFMNSVLEIALFFALIVCRIDLTKGGYTATVQTSSDWYAGTDGDVKIRVYGVKTGYSTYDTGYILLDSAANDFEGGSTRAYSLGSYDAGYVYQVIIGFSTSCCCGSDWKLNRVVLQDNLRSITYLFNYYNWVYCDNWVTFTHPVNGNWASWGSYGSCNRACGGGQKTRTRSCTNPVPKNGGNSCSGSSGQTIACNTHCCPVNGGYSGWSGWGSCNKACGGGQKYASRTCTNPSPSCGGSSCGGSSTKSSLCNTHCCRVNGGWRIWNSWQSCSRACGSGTRVRTRSCTNPSPSCGGSSCSGSSTSSSNCNTHCCAVNGGWRSWSGWQSCNKACGGGIRSRTRACDNPSPSCGGATCSGVSTSTSTCNTHCCRVDGDWGDWGAWQACSVACGGGTKSKTRSCNNPAPSCGGATCIGSATLTSNCNTHCCAVNGGWSTWGVWDACSLPCGGGTQSRTRTCDNPAPSCSGASCSGDLTSTSACNTQCCPVDGGLSSWSSWSVCTAVCGGGQQTQTRTCDNPTPYCSGNSCIGVTTNSTDCNTHACPIDGGWSVWANGTCSASCGPGIETQTRTCTDPVPAHGGADCLGESTRNLTCDIQPCHGTSTIGATTPLNTDTTIEATTSLCTDTEIEATAQINSAKAVEATTLLDTAIIIEPTVPLNTVTAIELTNSLDTDTTIEATTPLDTTTAIEDITPLNSAIAIEAIASFDTATIIEATNPLDTATTTKASIPFNTVTATAESTLPLDTAIEATVLLNEATAIEPTNSLDTDTTIEATSHLDASTITAIATTPPLTSAISVEPTTSLYVATLTEVISSSGTDPTEATTPLNTVTAIEAITSLNTATIALNTATSTTEIKTTTSLDTTTIIETTTPLDTTTTIQATTLVDTTTSIEATTSLDTTTTIEAITPLDTTTLIEATTSLDTTTTIDATTPLDTTTNEATNSLDTTSTSGATTLLYTTTILEATTPLETTSIIEATTLLDTTITIEATTPLDKPQQLRPQPH